MPDEILGIPVHPLLVHATVVLVPLAALGTVLIALTGHLGSEAVWNPGG